MPFRSRHQIQPLAQFSKGLGKGEWQDASQSGVARMAISPRTLFATLWCTDTTQPRKTVLMSASFEKTKEWREQVIALKDEVIARKETGLAHDPTTLIKLFSIVWRVRAICDYNKESPSADLDIIAQDLQYKRPWFDHLAHIGEWIILDRQTQKLPHMEYHDFWLGDRNIPVQIFENIHDAGIDFDVCHTFAILLEENGLEALDDDTP